MHSTEHVPGEFKCPDCGFVLVKSTIFMGNGVIARDTADLMEPCPNDGTIMRPVAWADALNEAREMGCEASKARNEAIDLLEKLCRRQAIVPSQIQMVERFLKSAGRGVRQA